MNRKGQLENVIITFAIVVVGLIIVAPIILYVWNNFVNPFASQLGSVVPLAETNITHISTVFINFWDWVILIGFLINALLVFITAFLVATHPIFLVLYIIFGALSFIFAPVLTRILDKMTVFYAVEYAQMPMVSFMKDYFGIILLGIWILSAIVLFGRMWYSRQNV